MSNIMLNFDTLTDIAQSFRDTDKKYFLIFAHNGTGKTRLSMEFKNLGKNGDERDTLYYNAFTEDLFNWDNDLEEDSTRVLKLNAQSRFFSGLQQLEMESRIRPLLQRYSDFDFDINYSEGSVIFKKEILKKSVSGELQNETITHIKVSRGEENIFVWCFFLAITQLAIDEDPAYEWVKYIYIDDPISSIDDNNVITVASHLAQLLKQESNKKKIIISTHHGLFYNVLFNELGKAKKYLLRNNTDSNNYSLEELKSDTPFYQHLDILSELKKVAQNGRIYTFHFNLLRNVLEKTAAFHGLKRFSDCIKIEDDDVDEIIHARRINILSHGNYSIFEPREMQEENKEHFRKILENFLNQYNFSINEILTETTLT